MKTKSLHNSTSKNRLALMFLLMAFLVPVAVHAQEPVTVTIGEGTSTYYFYPVNMYFHYSLTEQIYTADEIGTTGTINSISFYYNYSSSFSMNNVTFYMKNVTRSEFASNTDMEPLTTNDIVWSGTFSASGAGWITITLSNPFDYGGDNLLVAAYDGTSGYPGSSYLFRTTSCSGNKSIDWYSDSYIPDPYNTTGSYSGNKYIRQYRNNIKLNITPSTTPKPKNLSESNVTAHEATLSWTAPAENVTGYQYQYMPAGGQWTSLESTTNTSVTLTGLLSDTDYTFQVKALYPDNEESTFVSTTFHTEVSCPVPTDLLATFTEGDATVASLSWTENGSASNWVLEYGTASDFTDATQVNVSGTPSYNLTGLIPETKYYARVKADCGEGDQSQWSDAIMFRPTNCDIVTIGDETLSSSSCVIPVHMQYNFSLSQQIFTPEEIGTEGMIYTISFYYVASSSYPLSMNNVRVYMKNVTRGVFANDPDMEPLTSNDQVWRGTLSAFGPGWVTLTLDTPFAYDGVSNLLVAVWDPVTGKLTNNYGFRTNSCTEKMAICWYYDSNGPQLSDLISGYSGYKNRYSYRNVIQLGILPASCSRPADLQATLTEGNASIATLSWTENGEATNWVLEYGTAADFSDATSVNVSGTPSLDLSDLASETRYYARVKADCGSSQSEWSKTIEFRPTNCTHVAIGEGTESYISLPLCMQHDYSRAQQIFTAEEIGAEGMIYSISFYYQGLSPFSWNNIKMSMKHVTRSVFTDRWTMEPMSEDDVVWTGTFKASEPGWVTITLDSPFAYDGASNLLVQLFDGYSGGALGVNYTFRSSIYSDYQSIFWGNSYSVEQYASYGSGYNSMGYSKTRNDIIIDILPAPCQRPTNLHASLSVFSPTTASVSWREKGEATSWVLQYSTNNEFATYTEVTQDISVDGDTITAILTDLTPETTYYVRVKADCGSEQSQWSPTMEFMPTAYITIGDETNSNYALPISASAEYSFSQQIYTAEEIAAAGGGAGTITSVGFYYQGYTTAYTLEGIQVYMINTNKTNFSSYYDAVDLSLENKVYEGPLPLPTEGGWVTLTLDNEFDYDGTNILICVIDPTEGHLSGIDCQFYSSYSSEYKAINNSNNDVAYEYNNLSSIGINQNNYRNNIRFLPTFYPKPRYLTVSNITPHTADLSWAPHDSSVTGYQYQYKVGEGEWTTLESTTNTSLTLTELTPEGEYTFRVQALYGENAGDFNSIDFTVLATCPKPTDLQYALTLGDGTVATLTWEQGYFEEAWVLQYGTDSEFTEGSYTEMTTGFTVDGTTITANVTGLTPETSYYARVKANCAIDDQSYWSNVVAFTPTDIILHTIYDNDYTNENVPVRVRCVSYGTGNKSQFIIPAADIADVVDGQIKSLTFYIYRDVLGEESQDPPVFRVYFAEVDYTAFSSTDFYDWTAMTQVYEGNLVFGDDKMTMTITLDAPYLYNGGNLMIGFDEVTVGNINLQHCYYCPEDLNWSGQGSFNYNTAVYSYTWSDNTETTGQVDFLPKTTISYVNRGITDTPRPKYLASNTVLAYSANVTWSAPVEGVTGYQYQYKTDEGEWTNLVTTSDTLVHLTELTPLTHYTFRVKALYPDNAESLWASIGITTHNVCDVPTDLAYTLVPYNGSMAIISWMENGEATNWVLQYGTSETFEPEYTHEININDGFVREGNHVTYTLTGLTEVVTCVRVRPDCGEEELWSDFIYFTPAYASFAFNSNDSYNYYNNYVPVYGNYTHYGTASQFVIPGAMLADLAGTTIHRIRFRSYYNYIVSNSTFGDAVFEVFVKEVDNTSFASSDLADWADWDDLDRVYHGILTFSSKQMWIDFEEGFAYGGDNLLIGFKQITPGMNGTMPYWVGKGNGDTQCSVWAYKSYDTAPTFNYAGFASNYADSGPFLPEIIFRYIPAEYQRIDAVTTVDVTATTAQLSWEAPNANVTGYAYQYKQRNSEWPEEWTETTATEVTLQDLRQAAHHRFRVKALYGEHESAPFTVDFLTECDTYADIPLFEDFEGYGSGSGVMPYCWNRIGNDNCPNIQMASGENYLGRYYLAFKYGSSSNYPDQYAILPQMQNLDDLRVKLYARVENSDRPVVIYVGVMTDPADASTFTLVGEVNVSDYNYRKYKVSLENYTGGNGYIALKVAPTENGQYSNLFVDNVTVEPIPSCEEPEIEEAFDITGHTATLSWTDDGANAWQVYVSTENVLPAEPEGLQTVTTNPGTINGLEAETDYYVWMRSACGDGTYSPWSDVYTFTTNVACPTPIDVAVSNVTGHTATLSWTDPYGDPTEWVICLNEDEDHLVTADSNPFTLTGLEAEAEYNVKVKAWCGENDGYSEWSNEVYFYTPVSCLPVTDLQVTELGTTQATLTWGIDPQQGLDNMPTEWNVMYIAAPATLYDFESENTTPQYYVYSDNSETPWSIVEDADNAHSTSHYMQSPDCYGYIEFPAYGGGAASFWVKSLVEDVNVTIDVYYDSSFSGGGDEPGYKGRNNYHLGQFTVPFEAYKKITLDLADYQGEGTLRLQLEGQIALDDITVNMPGITVTNQTLDFNQGILGNDVYLDGWSLEYDGDNGYLVSEADYTNDWGGAYADFPIQLGGEVTFRAKALNVTEAVEYTVFVWDWNFDEVIAQTQISVSDAFAPYAWNLSDYSGMAYLEFIANNQPSLVIDDLTLDMPSMGYLTTTVSDNMLQMNDLQQFAVYTVGVQAHCGEDDDSQMAMPISFVPALCESDDQCRITCEWSSVGDWGNDVYIKVVDHESGLRVGYLEMDFNTSGRRTLSLCDGRSYDIKYTRVNSRGGYVDFTIYDAAGEVIADYEQFNIIPEEIEEPCIQFTMDCDVCQWPQNLTATNITMQSAQLNWEQGGDVTSWLVSYRDINAWGDPIINESNWTELPQGWLPLEYDDYDNLVASEDWTPVEGALVSEYGGSYLFVPVTMGGQAVVMARGGGNDGLGLGVYQGSNPVGMNESDLPQLVYYNLSENQQPFTVDLSGYQGNGYLVLYHTTLKKSLDALYLDQLVVYGEPTWPAGVVVNTPSYTLTGLTPGTTYQARVQAVCGDNEYSNPTVVSFVTSFCNPESQCEIHYELGDDYGYGWSGASISVLNGNIVVATLTMPSGSDYYYEGELPLCPGSYRFVWNSGNYSYPCYFTIYGPDGEVIAYKDHYSWLNSCELLDEPYEHFCGLEVMFTEGWNWWAPTMEISAAYLGDAIGEHIQGFMTESEFEGVFEPGEMYRICVDTVLVFSIFGTPATWAEIEIVEGTNWIGIIGDEPADLEDVFEDFEPVEGDKVISQDGGFAVYTFTEGVGSWVGTLTTLVPGKGYVYVSQASESKTLILGQ